MSNLCIDIGNTRLKAAIFSNGQLNGEVIISTVEAFDPLPILKAHPIERVIVSSVGAPAIPWLQQLKDQTTFISLSHQTPLPFQIHYDTPATLGMDRVAAVAGAQHFFPATNCLVIDAGTCITYELLRADGNYMGGSITPGVSMRLRSMHEHTARLPLLELKAPASLPGTSTETAMLGGVFHGVAGEMEYMLQHYRKELGQLQGIICGGDAALFAKHLKNHIFANEYLTLYGLNKILEFNAH